VLSKVSEHFEEYFAIKMKCFTYLSEHTSMGAFFIKRLDQWEESGIFSIQAVFLGE
jgi:hypothetical protein